MINLLRFQNFSIAFDLRIILNKNIRLLLTRLLKVFMIYCIMHLIKIPYITTLIIIVLMLPVIIFGE